MFISFAKKFETFTTERLPLGVSGSSAISHLYASNVLSALAFASIVSITFSIAVSQAFLALAIICWLYILVRHPQWNPRPILPVYIAFLFAIAVLLSMLFSSDPIHSLVYFKKFWIIFSLLLILPVAFRRSQQIETLFCWIAVGSTVSAGVAIFQYYFKPEISLTNRVTGLTGHWMTFSGLEMLSLLALLSLLISPAGRQYRWIYPAVPIQIFALVLAQTRSAWFGLLAGLLVLAFLVNWRWVMALVSMVAVGCFLLPQHFQDRLRASFNLADETTRIRIELLRTGWNMIRTHPFFGVGPRMVPVVYSQYNTTNEFPSWIYQHLHNDFVQIAAELGLIALAVWLAFVAAFFAHSVRQLAGTALPEGKKFAARAAISCIVALLVAGMFEYNFGDSEVLTLFLFFITSPYVIFREAASFDQGVD
ncbi:MAG TPA: O-antigen ligase family protein [Acidobacteriota bacterium]|jgi:O-antigen ligase